MRQLALLALLTGSAAMAEDRRVYLEDTDGTRFEIAALSIAEDQSYS